MLNQGYPEWMAMIGSVLASLSIIWLPFIIMILISRYLMTHRDSKVVKSVFAGLRPAIIGFIAAASLHAASLNLPAALLVDKGNPNAERLYRSVGFEYCNDAMWGGHEMRHLRCPIA